MFRPYVIVLTIASSGCLILADGPPLTDATYGLHELVFEPNFDVDGVDIVATASSDSFKFAESVVLVNSEQETIATPVDGADDSDVERSFVASDTSICTLDSTGLMQVRVEGPEGLDVFTGNVPYKLGAGFRPEDEERDAAILANESVEYGLLQKGSSYAFCGRLESTGMQGDRYTGDVDYIPLEFLEDGAMRGTLRTSPDVEGLVEVRLYNGPRVAKQALTDGVAEFYLPRAPRGTRVFITFAGSQGPSSNYEIRVVAQ